MVLNSAGDTLIAYKISKAKFLVKEAFRARELARLDSICESQRAEQNEIIEDKKIVILNQQEIINNNAGLLMLKEYELTSEKQKTTQANKETRQQKVGKWTAIIIGVIVSGYEAYLLFVKK